MKKLLLLSGLFIFTFTFAIAQHRWEMDFSATHIDSSGLIPNNHVDTVYSGSTIQVDFKLKNLGDYPNGTDSFPGGVYKINYYVSLIPDNKHPAISGSFSPNLVGVATNGTSSFQDAISIDTRFTVNKLNIIIIWPNEGKGSSAASAKDSLDSAKQTELYVFVKDKKAGTSGIDNSLPQHFKIYPNPVKDVLNIEMNNSGKGTVKVTDLAGKIISTKPFETAKGGHVSLILNGGAALPEGVYFINVETNNYSETSKILIDK